jgi:DNA-nicking Smr family endonuclease
MPPREKIPPQCSPQDSASEFPFGNDPVVLPIEDFLDLHAFSPKDIPSVVEEYLQECLKTGFSEVRLIHGKGAGVQRNIVCSVLSKHPAVLSYRDAPAAAGGWGATIVLLREPT